MPYCISFAGPPGCSKTPVAHYLSAQLGLPILSNDAVRSEVREDTLQTKLDVEEYERRILLRISDMVGSNNNFIHDASQDRRWREFSDELSPGKYQLGIISFDLSDDFYRQLLEVKGYDMGLRHFDEYTADHRKFLSNYPGEIICRITNENFKDRLVLSFNAAKHFIDCLK